MKKVTDKKKIIKKESNAGSRDWSFNNASGSDAPDDKMRGVEDVTNREDTALLGGTLSSLTGDNAGGKVHLVVLNGMVGGWYLNLDYVMWATRDVKAGDVVVFFMNSGGGYITEGLSMLNYIKLLDAHTIALVSYSASMMTQIALACDEVVAFKQSIFMIHNAQGIALGDHRQMRKTANLLEGMSKMLSVSYSDKTGLSSDEISAMMDEDTFLFGEDIVSKKFADKLLDLSSGDFLEQMSDAKVEGVDQIESLVTSTEDAEEENKIALNGMIEDLKDNGTDDILNDMVNCVGNCGLKLNDDYTMQDSTLNKVDKKVDNIEASKNDKGDNEMGKDVKEVDSATNIDQSTVDDAVATAVANETARVSAIMQVDGINEYLNNAEIGAMLTDGKSTANDVGAKLYGLLKADIANKVDTVVAKGSDGNKAVAEVISDAGEDNSTDADADLDDILNDDEKLAIAEAQIVSI